MVNEQDGRVRFEIDTRRGSDSIETSDRDVQFVAETESDEIEHEPQLVRKYCSLRYQPYTVSFMSFTNGAGVTDDHCPTQSDNE